MTKVVLGPTKGKFEEEEFDIMDNIISMVDEYQKKMTEIEISAQKEIAIIEEEKKKRILNLKFEFKNKLGGING